MSRLLLALLIAFGLSLPVLWAQDDMAPSAPSLDDEPDAGADDQGELGEFLSGVEGDTVIRFAPLDDPAAPLEPRLYWRRGPGYFSVVTAPVRMRLDGAEIIAPVQRRELVPAEFEFTYPVAVKKRPKPGDHAIIPGAVAFRAEEGGFSSKHPAFQSDADRELRILCAPVRLEAVNEKSQPVPVKIELRWQELDLLREAGEYNPLVIYLPVGADYVSNFGQFSVTADGKVQPKGSLPKGVELADAGLRKTIVGGVTRRPVSDDSPLIVRMQVDAKKSYEIFVPPTALPGRPVRVAVSRKAVEAATGRPIEAGRFQYQGTPLNPMAGDYRPAAAAEPDAAFLARAAQALRTAEADVAAFEWPVQGGLGLGAEDFHFNDPGVGAVSFTVVIADAAGPLFLVPHRQRTVYAQHESATFVALAADGFPGGPARVLLDDRELGTVRLPAVKDRPYDSRTLTVDFSAVPPGTYALRIDSGGQRSGVVPVTVVPWHMDSLFFVHSMSGCTGWWPWTDEGLSLLKSVGMEMGAGSASIGTEMPRIEPATAERLRETLTPVPAELTLRPGRNDLLLQQMMRYEMRFIDLTVNREAGFYLEGLSYHHSYKPSVDRMIRRMQIFSQQTADYPSFWGVNYSWFPALFGYAEGGVPTDAHVADRNRTLEENVRKAGFKPLTADERKWYAEHKTSTDPAERDKAIALMRQATDHWKAQHRLGWGDHNKLYNDAVREVRPNLAFTLFENAGHDLAKRTRYQFNDLNAVCYESYTDYGDWPMAAGFTVEWGRGNYPGMPVWLTTCWGTSADGKAKSLFHAFSRGMEGGGVPMQAEFEMDELARRGKAMAWTGLFGAIATRATPDNRVGILSTSAQQIFGERAQYVYHAVYSHLTRLGYPAVILDDEDIAGAGAIPEHVKVLVIAQQEQPYEPKVLDAIKSFVNGGGKIIQTADTLFPIDGAITVDKPVRDIWDMHGFEPRAHDDLWAEFLTNWKEPLAAAMAQTGLPSRATTDPLRGYALALDAGPVRYVTVVADAAGTHSNIFQITAKLPVSLEGEGWLVRDLVKQANLEGRPAAGRTEISVDLITEPATVLALYRSAPAKVTVRVGGTPALGAALSLAADVAAGSGESMGPVPVRITLTDASGKERGAWNWAAGEPVNFTIPQLDQPGAWTLAAQELLTGLTTTATLDVAAAAAPGPVVAEVGDVHVVNESQVAHWLAKPGEKLVLVESSQTDLLPVARKLVESLAAKGVQARLWEVQPGDIDTQPIRYYFRDYDQPRLEAIAAADLIGYRQPLAPYIDEKKKVHVPQFGGTPEIPPFYMLERDAVVFSGGPMAESLRSVTAWMDTPNVPGAGQGRLVVTFSPFTAGRDVLAVIAHDLDGYSKAAERLVEQIGREPSGPAWLNDIPGPRTARTVAVAELKPVEGRTEPRPVPQPFSGYTPVRRVVKLVANDAGQAGVFLVGREDTLVLVDAAGKITASVDPASFSPAHASIDASGRVWDMAFAEGGRDPSWGFVNAGSITRRAINPDGTLALELPAYLGTTQLPTDYPAGFPVSPDGGTILLGRLGGAWLGDLNAGTWQYLDDLPFVRERYEVTHPRVPVGTAWSPDSTHLFMALDTRPPVVWNGGPSPKPMGSEAVLLDAKTGKTVWRLRDPASPTAYATISGLSAVARGGAMTAVLDYDGTAWLIDKAGKAVLRQAMAGPPSAGDQSGRPDGAVRVTISDDGSAALFAFKRRVFLVRGSEARPVEFKTIVDAAITPDGSLALVATDDGLIHGLKPDGSEAWSFDTGGVGARVAAFGGNQALVATSDGGLIALDGQGKELRRVDLAAAADVQKHVPIRAADAPAVNPPVSYRDPGTLAVAKSMLGAKKLGAWKPEGETAEAFGLTFAKAAGELRLSTGDYAGDAFVHLVYRRPAENKSLKVSITVGTETQTFDLDLPTPEYRVAALPVSGRDARVVVVSDGPVEIADLSFWSIQWPGSNVAFVRPAGGGTVEIGGIDDLEDEGDIMGELTGEGGAAGVMKDSKTWSPNTDPDLGGTFNRSQADPYLVINGRRFDKTDPWATGSGGNWGPRWGGLWTVTFPNPVKVCLVATYDRVFVQSELSQSLAVFTGEPAGHYGGNPTLGGATGNDQFWRLIPVPEQPVTVLGVQALVNAKAPAGLSEVEAYRRD